MSRVMSFALRARRAQPEAQVHDAKVISVVPPWVSLKGHAKPVHLVLAKKDENIEVFSRLLIAS